MKYFYSLQLENLMFRYFIKCTWRIQKSITIQTLQTFQTFQTFQTLLTASTSLPPSTSNLSVSRQAERDVKHGSD